MPLKQPLPTKRDQNPQADGSNSCTLATASFADRALRSHESDRGSHREVQEVDEIGPHRAFLREFSGLSDSYSVVPAGQPRGADERRFRDVQEQMRERVERRGREADLPKGVHVIDLGEVLADQGSSRPIQDFKEFLDRAGVIAGETSYLRFPDGSVSAVRRRVLDNATAANEVVWVETFAAIGHLHNLQFLDRGADLVQPIPHDVRGFFDPNVRIAVMAMIDKRNGRTFSEWRAESLVILQTAVHELEHGRGGGEYQARAAADAYLYRNGVIPTPGDPVRRVESICLGWYTSEEYSAAVGDAMRELKVPSLIIPARIPDSRVESVPIPMLASASIATFESHDAMQRGDGADLSSYGLTTAVGGRWNGRRMIVCDEGPSSHSYSFVGEPLGDRILQETLPAQNLTLRILVAEAISHHVAHESARMAKMLKIESLTSQVMRNLADRIAINFEPGDVHRAVREYTSLRGGAAVIPHGKDTLWINSLPEGVAMRRADSITIYLASPRHRGAALRIPIGEGESYGNIADRVRAFERDSDRIDALHASRSGRLLWESVAVPEITRGARYLFSASRSVKASNTRS